MRDVRRGSPTPQVNGQGYHDLLCIRDANGVGWVVVRRMCEALGLNEESQRKRLLRQPWARTVIMTARDSAGKVAELFCLHVDDVRMWLGPIQASR